MPVGVTAKLSFQDLSNVYQPVISVYAGIFAVGLYGVVRELVRSRWLAAGVALVAVQASLFVGYAWWGSIKEICVAALLPVFVLVARAGHPRALLVVGLVAAAFMDSFGAGGVLWAGAGCAAAALLALSRPLGRFFAWSAGAFAVVVAGSVPAIVVLEQERRADDRRGRPPRRRTSGSSTRRSTRSRAPGCGRPATSASCPTRSGSPSRSPWPVSSPPSAPWPSPLRRRAWLLPALLVVTIVGAVPALAVGGPWIDAKVLAVTAAVLLCGTAALVAIGIERLPAMGIPAAALLVDRDRRLHLARRPRRLRRAARHLTELRSLGDQVAGKGPYLLLNYEGYATRYQLYRADVEGASDLRVSLIPGKDGQPFPNFSTVEVDDVDTAALFAFPLIGRRLTPVGSRPPSGYEPFSQGAFFETWQRKGDAARRAPVARRRRPARGGGDVRAAASSSRQAGRRWSPRRWRTRSSWTWRWRTCRKSWLDPDRCAPGQRRHRDDDGGRPERGRVADLGRRRRARVADGRRRRQAGRRRPP